MPAGIGQSTKVPSFIGKSRARSVREESLSGKSAAHRAVWRLTGGVNLPSNKQQAHGTALRGASRFFSGIARWPTGDVMRHSLTSLLMFISLSLLASDCNRAGQTQAQASPATQPATEQAMENGPG